MEKFNRVYSLSVELDPTVIVAPLRAGSARNVTITLPYTIKFQISRRTLTSAQTGTFRVYNLGTELRNAIQKDVFQFRQLRAIQFRAGYYTPNGSFMPLVFNGNVLTAYSYRDGVNWITEIEAFDGGWQMANANIALALSEGTTASDVVRQLASALPQLKGDPIIGTFPTKNLRGEVLFGNVWELLIQKTNGQVMIDNGQVKALQYNEAINGELPLISSETGLLGSPKRTTSTLEFDMIFEPRLTVAQIVLLETKSNLQFNRPWKVMAFDHHGTISEDVCEDCLTTVYLWFTLADLTVIRGRAVQ